MTGSSSNTSRPRSHGGRYSDSSDFSAMMALAFETARAALAPYSWATSSTMRVTCSMTSFDEASELHCSRQSGMSIVSLPAMVRALSWNETLRVRVSTTA